MADRLRLVRLGPDGRARLVRELEAQGVTYKLRDTFVVGPGDRMPRMAATGTRRGGEHTIGETRSNGFVSATFNVKGADAYEAATRMEALLASIDTADPDLRIAWRPDGLLRTAYFEIRGPATWRPLYSAVEWPQTHRLPVEISWPVAPDPHGLPLAFYERWTPPADREGGTINEATNPTGQDGTTTGWTPSTANNDAASFIATQEQAREGGWSIRMIRDAGAGVGAVNMSLTRPARPGETWSLGAFFRAGSTGRTSQVQLLYQDAAGATLSTLTATTADNNGVWTRATLENQLAPPATAQVQLRCQLTNVPEGEAHYVADVVAVKAPALPAAARVDGTMDLYRYEGAFSRSRTVELEESKLAPYTVGPAAETTRQITEAGFRSSASGTAALLAHAESEPHPDHEVVVRGRYVVSTGIAGNEYHYMLSPGVRYRADDGAHIFATVHTGRLRIYRLDVGAGTPTQVTTDGSNLAGAEIPAIDTSCYLAIRAEGLIITAEWYGTNVPDARRTNWLRQITYQIPVGDVLGADRAGHPMPRAYGGDAPGVAVLEEANMLGWVYPGLRVPTVVTLPGIPGTAPARLDVDVQPEQSGPPRFALVAARRRPSAHNRAWNGDVASTDRWSAAAIAGVLAAGGSVAASAGAGPDAENPDVISITASGAINSGGAYRIDGRFRRGRSYTVELRGKRQIGTAGWQLRFARDGTIMTETPTLLDTYDAGVQRFTFTATVSFDRLEVVFRRNPAGAAGDMFRVAGLRVYEGNHPQDAPPPAVRRGRGGFPPLAVIRATERITSASSGSWSEGGTAADPTMTVTMSAGAAVWLAFALDVQAIAPPDFGEELDLEVWAVGDQASTWTVPRLRAALEHEDGGPQIFAREDPEADGRLLATPSATKRRLWRLGTLPIGRSRRTRGRYRLELRATSGAGSSGSFVARYLIVVPTSARLSTPTGKSDDADYPAFAAGLVEYDGTGWVLDRHGYRIPRSGLGGDPLEIDPGEGELLAAAYSHVPDSPDAGDAGDENLEPTDTLMHARVTPRYRLLAPAKV